LGESSGSGGVSSSDAADAAAELEKELQDLRQKEEAEAGEGDTIFLVFLVPHFCLSFVWLFALGAGVVRAEEEGNENGDSV
jgi:hypothetical protein